MKQKIYGGVAAIVFIVVGLGVFVYLNIFPPFHNSSILPGYGLGIHRRITNYDECAEATNLVFTSYPSKCFSPDGRVFVAPLFNETMAEEFGE